MSRAWRLWGVGFSMLALTGLAVGAPQPQVTLQLIKREGVLLRGPQMQRVCRDESNFEVYSPGLVIHTLKAEEMADPTEALKSVFGQHETRVVFEKVLTSDHGPDGSTSGASVTAALDRRDYVIGVVFPGKGGDPDVYRVRIQEKLAGPARAPSASTSVVVPPTLLSVPVRCPRGYVGVVGFSNFEGEPLFLVVRPGDVGGGK